MQKNTQSADKSKQNVQATIEQKKEQNDLKQDKQFDQFDQVLNNFDQTPLNLTNDDKDKDDEEDDPQMMAKLKQECENFMKQMQGGLGSANQSSGQQDIDMDNIGNMFGNLLKGLSDQMGSDSGEGQQFSKKFTQMFKGLNQGNVEDAATKLLNQFMDKSLLLQPMKQTKVNYQQFFTKQKSSGINCSQADLQNYKKQYEIVNKILHILEEEPGNKTEMIRLFEQMQQYGNPPEGIAPHTNSFF